MYTFHLVLSTIGRSDALQHFLDTLDAQGESVFITLVEQSGAPSCATIIAPWVADGRAEYVHEPVVRGLSRGRNRGIRELRGDIVGFPDDDCWYPDGLLASVRERLGRAGVDGRRPDGVSTRLSAPNGAANLLRWLDEPVTITASKIPRTVTSATLFLRRDVVERVGDFDEMLGSGSGTPFGAGEETDYVLRALALGAVIDYRPELRVYHPEWRDEGPEREVLAKVRRYNRGFGRVLRKHHRWGEAAFWIGRSCAAVLVAFVARDSGRARFQVAQLRGRLEGFIARV
ncbi:glycosyltransferase [Curtobacterium sp. DN_7.5]|uniref:glycosyltransferase family 2 protein n=1 Tax=Curtobacterium sp. DN_7.5 TaxID=3049047 RepID=UPI001F574BCF|nr:glycosyltransferase [Curtobacterium sp. DN_7.5]